MCNFLNDLTVPSLTTEQSLSCKGNLTEKEIYNPLISFENKSPGIMGSQKIDAPFGLTLKTHL